MKRFFVFSLSLFFMGLAILALVSVWGVNTYLGDGPLNENKFVVVERGSGVSAIAQKLVDENVISQTLIFKIVSRFQGSLKAGEYEFFPQISMADVFQKMEKGEVFDRKFTIPEGLTRFQIIKILKAQEDLSGEIIGTPKEGSLLPDTYHFTKDQTRQQKIDEMQTAMTKTIDELWEKRAADLPFQTKEEALTLASIVEKETGVAAERQRIAGVFVNRLKRGIALQTDPTVIYALTNGQMKDEGKGPLGRRLLLKDLEFNSPYNTYKNSGLPPGPICNPGRAAIEATLNPESNDYIFFVADGTGGHVFSSTLAEHNANVAKWRQIRKESKQ